MAAGRLAGAAALIAVLTVASRVAGFGRTVVFARTVTDNDLGDIYLAVNTIPNIVFEIVAGGALASMVVPLLAGAVAAGKRATVSATTSALLTWTLIVLVPLALAVAALAGPIVALLTPDGSSPAQIATGERMLRVFAPQLPLYGVGIVLAGLLQAHHRFAWPVIAPFLSSITVIGAYVTFAIVEGRGTDIPYVSRTGELILSVGTTLGVVVLSLCLLIPVRRLGLRLRPAYAFPAGTRRTVSGLALAGAVTVAAQQLALLVALRLAFDGPEGAVVHYNLAQTVYLLPWAVLAVPVATAAFPRLAAAGAADDTGRYAGTLAPAVRGVLLLSCLGAAVLVAVAGPAGQLLVDGRGTGAVTAGIVGFAPGLLGYALFALLSRALYARGDTGAAAAATAAGWAVTVLAAVGLAAGLADSDRVLALALGNSAGMLVVGAVLLVVVARRAGAAALRGLARVGAIGALAGSLAAAAGVAVARVTVPMVAGTPPDVRAALQGMLSGVAVGVVFLAVAYPLDRHDMRTLVGRRRGGDRQREEVRP
ncbi:MAG TPA: lipid II flippase MurJ [Pilimelia sp.]|nr:lipid II flippase MurJ [Pilimelia sp.]